jgi:4-hydroxybenzoate polyprenyltransferase
MAVPQASPAPEAPSGSRRTGLGDLTAVHLARAAHPRRAVVTAAALAAAAAVSGRPLREVALVLATVLVGQALLGWDNDLVDQSRDRVAERGDKPIASGALDRGTVWFCVACAVLLVIPLSLSNGLTAGASYLLSLVIGVAGNRLLRWNTFSWLPWAFAFALYPAFLSYGGWGGAAKGHPPTVAMTLLAALLGVGVHVLTSLGHLVDDNDAGHHHLPLQLALRVGAPRLLVYAGAYCVVLVALMCVVGATVGLSQ